MIDDGADRTMSSRDLTAAPRDTLRVLALGSPHGDDQIAWRCAERLGELMGDAIELVKLAEPLELLDHLDGCRRLMVLDACVTGQPEGTILRFDWPDPRLISVPSGGSTHAWSLDGSLQLARQLGRLPARVIVLAIEIEPARAGHQLTDRLAARMSELVAQLRWEIEQANSTPDRGPAGVVGREAGRYPND